MNFLDALGGVGGDDDFQGAGAFELAAGFAEQEQSVHAKTSRGFDGADDIGGIAAGADGQEQVAGFGPLRLGRRGFGSWRRERLSWRGRRGF